MPIYSGGYQFKNIHIETKHNAETDNILHALVAARSPHSGLMYGYSVGGGDGQGSPNFYHDHGTQGIRKYAFSNDTFYQSGLTEMKYSLNACGSSPSGGRLSGYVCGSGSGHLNGAGSVSQQNSNITSPDGDWIDKISFSSDGNGTHVADCTYGGHTKCSASSFSHGYIMGGGFDYNRNGEAMYSLGTFGLGGMKLIDKFSYATEADATEVSELEKIALDITGFTTPSHGYAVGGYTVSGNATGTISGTAQAWNAEGLGHMMSYIRKLQFATDSDAVNVASMGNTVTGTLGVRNGAGFNTMSKGIYAGGCILGLPGNSIYNDDSEMYTHVWAFSYINEGESSHVGDLAGVSMGYAGLGRHNPWSCSSLSGGYQANNGGDVYKLDFASMQSSRVYDTHQYNSYDSISEGYGPASLQF